MDVIIVVLVDVGGGVFFVLVLVDVGDGVFFVSGQKKKL